MPKIKSKIHMSPRDITKDIYYYKTDSRCNCCAPQRIWNYSTREYIDTIIVEEREIDTFLQLLGTLNMQCKL
jgi:hypothetical protein